MSLKKRKGDRNFFSRLCSEYLRDILSIFLFLPLLFFSLCLSQEGVLKIFATVSISRARYASTVDVDFRPVFARYKEGIGRENTPRRFDCPFRGKKFD